MPPKVRTAVDYRHEFVLLAIQEGANIRALCRRFPYAPNTAYKWIVRYREGGLAALEDRPRRPATSPRRTPPEQEAAVIAQRDEQPSWGGRKLHAWLGEHGMEDPPAPSTVTNILHRHGRIQAETPRQGPFQRFEHPSPNDLWQLDFMGHRPLAQGRVHPFTVVDDHSRFGLALVACADERRPTVERHLLACFHRYGLPRAILADNGPPWGRSGGTGLTGLEAWWMRLGIVVVHGRSYHPQTQGKIERWHGTISRDIFQFQPLTDLAGAQVAFDRFRTIYNTDRPHESLNYAVPVSRYQPSARAYPATLPAIEYAKGDAVRKVSGRGGISFQGHRYFVSQGLAGLPVGIRPTSTDGVFTVRFCQQEILTIDLHRTT